MMERDKAPYLERVKGDTWCVVTGFCRFPFYKLDGKNVVLLDSGLGADRQGIAKALESAGLRVRAVLTTHVHVDHAGNHRYFKENHNARIYAGAYDAAIMGDPVVMAASIGGESYRWVLGYAKTMTCPVDELLDRKAEAVTVEGARFQIVPLDGHAPEHLGFVTPDGAAYVGDALLTEDIMGSIKIPHCCCCELDLESRRRAGELPCDCFIIAHNGVASDGRALAEKNINYILERVEGVRDAAAEYMTLSELTGKSARALGTVLDNPFRIALAEQNVRCYVQFLMDQGALVNRARDGKIEYIRADLA